MSATPALPEAELLELLVQLQKTTPDQARTILNGQPAIAYALVPLMVRMNIVNLDALQKTLASYAAPPTAPAQPPQVAPAIPAQLAASQMPYHQPTPPPMAPTPTPAYPLYQQNGAVPSYPPQYAQQPQYPAQAPPAPYGMSAQHAPTPAPQAGGTAAILGALGNIPDEQKEMIMRVIAMTPEQINQLPPQDRAITVQLRATLGLPTQ